MRSHLIIKLSERKGNEAFNILCPAFDITCEFPPFNSNKSNGLFSLLDYYCYYYNYHYLLSFT